MSSTSSSSAVRVNCRRKAKKKYLHQKDVCATFNLLCHEKRRLLYKAESSNEQINNKDRRQHSVLQRMSAFDRYKRKRSQVREHELKTVAATSADNDTPDQMRTDATAPSVVDQTPPPPPPDLAMPLRIIDEVRQSFLNEFGGEDQSVERSVAAQEFARVSATIGSDLARRAKN